MIPWFAPQSTEIAGGDIETQIEHGNAIAAQLRPIIKNKFEGNTDVLAAWGNAVRYPERDKTKPIPPPH